MSGKSTIEWTDATWNPTTGCDRVSPGCAKCYAKALHDKRHQAFLDGWTAAPAQYHQPFEVVQTHADRLEDPLHWREPRMVFVDSVSDLFYGNEADRLRCVAQEIPFHPVPFEFLDMVFAVMAITGRHTYQILTKRVDRALEYLTARAKSAQPWKDAAREFGHALEFDGISLVSFPLPNVWLGVSVENQHFADERIPLLLQTPAAVRFISAEPLLGDVNLLRYMRPPGPPDPPVTGSAWAPRKVRARQYLDWVIVGGESGHGARPFHIQWARNIVRQCRLANLPVFVKQLGAQVRAADVDDVAELGWREDVDHALIPLPHAGALGHKKGGDPAEWPEDLRVREFPEPRA